MASALRLTLFSLLSACAGSAATSSVGAALAAVPPATSVITAQPESVLPPSTTQAAFPSAPAEPVDQQALAKRLDAVTQAALHEYPLASVSVAVLRGEEVLFSRAYGHAELNFAVPATTQTRYRLIGPGTTLLVAAVLRAAEQGRLKLDDDASKYLPDFPWKGKRVTIRQLLNATSGLQDYHYLGDAWSKAAPQPMRTDEVTALFANRHFVHEPGADWSWTISGYHLAGMILEKLTGEPYPNYLQREVLTPAKLTGIVYCDGVATTPALARGYRLSDRFSTDVRPTVSAVRFLNSFCGTAMDAALIPAALKRLLRPESFRAIMAAEGAAGAEHFGLGAWLGDLEGRAWWGLPNHNLAGYGTSSREFPDQQISVVALTNTGVGLGRLSENLARTIFGLPTLPARAAAQPPLNIPTTSVERKRLTGLYRGRPVEPESQHRANEQTLCVYEEAGRLMGQYGSSHPFLLLKQDASTFAGSLGTRESFRFTKRGDKVVGVEVLANGQLSNRGARESERCS